MMNIDDVLTKLKDIRASQQVRMCAGTCGGGTTIEGQMVNYRVAVVVNSELSKIIDQIESDMKKETDVAESVLRALDDDGVAIKDAFEEES